MVTVATCAKTAKGGSDKDRERETKSETDGRLDGAMASLATLSSSEETSDGFNFDLV